MLLLTVGKLKFLITVRVLLDHLLQHLLVPRITHHIAFLQRNVINIVLY